MRRPLSRRHTTHERSSVGRALVILGFVVSVTSVIPAAAQAQSDDAHWGVSFSSTPTWSMANKLKQLVEDGEVDISGSELTVGVVHGRRLGGDWGVSYVRKPFKDGSGIRKTDTQCVSQATCLPTAESDVLNGVVLSGVEVHWFIPFATIKDRAQIGINLGGGAAKVSGSIVETKDGFDVTSFNPQTGAVTTVPKHTVETLDAGTELVSTFPLAKVEVEGSVILGPAFKVKVAGGLNFPSFSARVILMYLFAR